jgi:Aminotransferase class I and II
MPLDQTDVQCIIILALYADRTYIEPMDLRRLRTFVAVAELALFRKQRCAFALGSLPFRGKSEGLFYGIAAITPRARLVIINTPHNPTGRIYSSETLVALAQILDRASERIGRRVFLLSDEPYRRIRFGDCGFVSPSRVYPWTVVTYSYAKVLLAPGQRLGYLAVSPRMPWEERQVIRNHMSTAQVALGWCFPNAVMQYAIP